MGKLTGKIVKAIRVGDGDTGRVIGNSLKALRELAGLTQEEMARRLKVGQASISKIEHRGDVQISSLQKYVEALGAKLRIDARFSPSQFTALNSVQVFDADVSDDDQLIFPIFGEDLFKPHRDVVLSIKPEYSEKIIQGTKTVELRRRFPLSAPRGTIAYIYCTSPVRAMIGRAEIMEVVKLPIGEIWKQFSSQASIKKPEFQAYFSGLSEGFVLKFNNAKALPRQLELNELRERFGFEPPQSYLYANPTLRRALQDEYASVSN